MLPRILLVWTALATCLAQVAGAAPFVPTYDDELLETLPRATDGDARELRALREALAREPERLDLALDLAGRWLALGRANGDPRPAGWAEGVLAPWLAKPEPPSAALLLRATLRQNRHDFAGALDDLGRVLERDPRSAQAWLTRAVILQVQGDAAAAASSCRPLLRLADPLAASTCLANAAGLAGQGARARALLEGALARGASASPELRLWAWTSLAELAARLGEDVDAERAFAAAFAVGPPDPYLLAARADFLLERGRAPEALALLADHTASDGLLLRVALAEQATGAAEVAAHAAELRARFAASRARGDSLHAGEEARYRLAFDHDARGALELAARNFAVQREPRDAGVLLETALAAREPGAAQPALEWLAASRLEDAKLAALARRVEALR